MTCGFCSEEILPGERMKPVKDGVLHEECLIRMVCGSAEHINGECSCYRPSGMVCREPENLTLRESAKRAQAALYAKRQIPRGWYGSPN